MNRIVLQIIFCSVLRKEIRWSCSFPASHQPLLNTAADNNKEVMLAGCVRHRKRQRNRAPCHQPLTSAGGMWEKAKPNPSQIKLACKRPSFLKNFWIKYWLQPARFHWKWLCQLVLNNSLSCMCFLCCFPLSVDFPIDTKKLNLLLNTFLFLLTWQTRVFESD